MNIEIDYYFAATFVLLILTNQNKALILGLITMLIHEFGHVLLMSIFDEEIKKIRLTCGTIEIITESLKEENQNNTNEILTSFGGSIMNFIMSAFSITLFKVTNNRTFEIFSQQNLCTGIINLLPIKGLDGGDILKYFLKKFFKTKICDMILNIISIINLLLIVISFILYFPKNCEFSIYFFIIYLILCLIIQKF